ncbi:GtrA family protein [Vibrio tubiashii ATCC 19109]|uniref:GtrA family protein n=1 Tax=Vibrio tubiashii ATCC 19109 TaxID=1051646 RepID=A0ABN0DLF9_9VIBR|nr:GtrA family protein [Vibrio tubiashii ATCC 19109]
MQFIKFLSVGVINTVIGYGTFLVFLRFLAIDPEVANAIGYLFALTVAFFLNKNFVFGGGVILHLVFQGLFFLF